jgi:hypothetical protein
MSDITFVLLITAIALNGVVVGATLDQSIKQLPARHRISAVAYSIYSRAGDLGNGIAWYASVGVGAVLITLAAAIAVFSQRNASPAAPLIYIAAVLSILHSLVTTQAAPIMFSQRRHENDEKTLETLFNRFERWQTLRAFLQVLTFGALLWAVIMYMR